MEQEKIVYERKDKDALIEELHLINDFLSDRGPMVDLARKRKLQLIKILDKWEEEDAAAAADAK